MAITFATAWAILAAMVLIIAGLIRLLRRPGDADDPDSDSGSGGGGGLPPNAPPEGSGGGAGEPVWWPSFEREFAEYVARARVLARDR